MKPVLFELGPLRIYGYGVMIALGGVLSAWFLSRRAPKLGLKTSDDVWLLINSILLGGFAGGRLLYVLEYTRWLSRDFWISLFSLSRGFSVLGAFAGVPLAVWLFCCRRGVSFLRVLDSICVMAPLWHVFGRLGCLLAGCCYGKPTSVPWGLAFTDPRSQVPAVWLGVPLHPTQLYEAAGDAVIAGGLFALLRRTDAREPGLVAAAYFASYGILRFALENYRGDTVPLGFLGLTAGQGLAAGLIVLSMAIAARRSLCSRPS